MFIVIEGLDGSGKSTISKYLAKKLDAKLLSTPGIPFKGFRKQLDNVFKNNPKARQLFYMATVLNVADEAKALITCGNHVVVDRYWLSTQVYHRWMSSGEHYELIEVERELLKPDFTIYLDLPVDERIVRINDRSNCTLEDSQTLSQQADDELRDLYVGMSGRQPVGKWLLIDASQSINAIVDTILSRICKTV